MSTCIFRGKEMQVLLLLMTRLHVVVDGVWSNCRWDRGERKWRTQRIRMGKNERRKYEAGVRNIQTHGSGERREKSWARKLFFTLNKSFMAGLDLLEFVYTQQWIFKPHYKPFLFTSNTSCRVISVPDKRDITRGCFHTKTVLICLYYCPTMLDQVCVSTRVHAAIKYHIVFYLKMGSCYFPAVSCPPVCNLNRICDRTWSQYPWMISNFCNSKHIHNIIMSSTDQFTKFRNQYWEGKTFSKHL